MAINFSADNDLHCGIHGCNKVEEDGLIYDNPSGIWMCLKHYRKYQSSEPGRKISGWTKYNARHPKNPIPQFRIFKHEQRYRHR